MNLKQLETLYWIERLGSFTAAAERLDASQSTVSARIDELEQLLGVELFDRSRRVPRLTPKGKEMAAYARRLIALAGEMRERATPEASVTGRVKIGVAEPVARTWLPRFVRELHERHPGIALELEIALSADIVGRVKRGDYDVLFSMWPSLESGYVAHPLGSSRYDWVASPDLGLPKGKLKPKDLDGFPLLAAARHAFHYANIVEWVRRHDVRPLRIDTCSSQSILAVLAAAGLGVTALPVKAFSDMIGEGRLIRLNVGDEPAVVLDYYAVHVANPVQGAIITVCDLAVEISDFDKIPAKPTPAKSRPRR